MSEKSSAQKAQKLFVEAATRLQKGDATGARRRLEKVSRLAPSSAAVWYNLALAGQHLGLHSKAIKEYEKSLSISPGQADALVNLGLSYKHVGNADAALASARKALSLAPSHSRALNLHGSLLGESGDLQAALSYFRKSLEYDPENDDAKQNLTSVSRNLLACGDPEQALEALGSLLAQSSITFEQKLLHGQILLELRQFEFVRSILADLKSRFPGKEDVLHLELAYCESIKDYFSAIDVAKKILAISPNFASVWNCLGKAYFELGSIGNARDSFQKAIDNDPENPEYRNHIGLTHAALGDRRQAEENYRIAISLNNGDIEAYRNLILMRKFTSLDDPDVVALEAMWKREDQRDDTRCKLAFALGKVYDDCGLYDRAFEIYEVGNRIKSIEIAQNGFDFDRFFNHIHHISSIFNKPPLVTSDVYRMGVTQPIFIVGMTRSGTTLVEQIISRHPEVTGCGELPCIERAITRLEKDHGPAIVYPDDFPLLDVEVLNCESREYLDWVARLHDLTTTHFTDKLPFNFAHIWLIKALFPEAAIVHCHRHPLDVIISNYFQLFSSEINYVYDLQILAKFYICYHRLMKHWQAIFPGAVYKVQYEALVADKENQIRQLITGVGLGWDDACFDQGRADMAVRTASIWQIRQGIYASSKGRWRHYEAKLSPAIRLLQTEGILDTEMNLIH